MGAVSKYLSRKTVVDGIAFASKKEADKYVELKLLKKAGIIKDFVLQPRFLLQEAFEKNGKRYKKIEYIADFLVIYPDGRKEVIDTKGYETEVFKLKRKLFEYKYRDLSLTVER